MRRVRAQRDRDGDGPGPDRQWQGQGIESLTKNILRLNIFTRRVRRIVFLHQQSPAHGDHHQSPADLYHRQRHSEETKNVRANKVGAHHQKKTINRDPQRQRPASFR